jgi:hypothetical protein
MENFYLIPEYKKAFIGTTLAKPTNQTVAVYDFEKCIKIIMETDKLPYDEAMETLYFNTINADLGDKTPIIIQRHNLKEMEGWDFDE